MDRISASTLGLMLGRGSNYVEELRRNGTLPRAEEQDGQPTWWVLDTRLQQVYASLTGHTMDDAELAEVELLEKERVQNAKPKDVHGLRIAKERLEKARQAAQKDGSRANVAEFQRCQREVKRLSGGN